ncbi:MAG TPA: hypothetical protein VM734_16605 [Kofleriaceae bacterium]|nr:hypothetical protein [Kofleriaceae bacterium]
MRNKKMVQVVIGLMLAVVAARGLTRMHVHRPAPQESAPTPAHG